MGIGTSWNNKNNKKDQERTAEGVPTHVLPLQQELCAGKKKLGLRNDTQSSFFNGKELVQQKGKVVGAPRDSDLTL